MAHREPRTPGAEDFVARDGIDPHPVLPRDFEHLARGVRLHREPALQPLRLRERREFRELLAKDRAIVEENGVPTFAAISISGYWFRSIVEAYRARPSQAQRASYFMAARSQAMWALSSSAVIQCSASHAVCPRAYAP